MATQVDAARLLTLRSAAMKDAGMKTTQQSAMAKVFASEVAVAVGTTVDPKDLLLRFAAS